MRREKYTLNNVRLAVLCLLASAVFPPVSQAQAAPAFEITHAENTMKFAVESSVAIVGKFDKWDTTLTFISPELSTGVLDIKIYAASVDTGSGMKNGKLKGKDFFDVEHNPLITFHSTKVVQTAPTQLNSTATSRFAESPSRRSSRLRFPATRKVLALSKG
jgi:polyisoprenoid-binding protein YceI